MDILNKPAIRKFPLIAKCLLGLGLAVFTVFSILDSLSTAQKYRELMDDAVSVDAVITHVETEYDPDGDTYDAMMKYKFDGVTYTDTYRNYSSRRDAEDMVGRTVTIEVNPWSPSEEMREIRGDGRSVLMNAAIGLCLFLLTLGIRHRCGYVEDYGWNRETVKKDLIRHIWRKSKFYCFMLPIVMWFLVGLWYPEVYLGDTLGDIIGVCILLICCWRLVCFIKKLRLVYQDRFFLTRDTLVKKEDLSDSESNYYRVTYRGSNGVWSKKVSYGVYKNAREGDIFESVYMEGGKKPALSYSHNTGTF